MSDQPEENPARVSKVLATVETLVNRMGPCGGESGAKIEAIRSMFEPKKAKAKQVTSKPRKSK